MHSFSRRNIIADRNKLRLLYRAQSPHSGARVSRTQQRELDILGCSPAADPPYQLRLLHQSRRPSAARLHQLFLAAQLPRLRPPTSTISGHATTLTDSATAHIFWSRNYFNCICHTTCLYIGIRYSGLRHYIISPDIWGCAIISLPERISATASTLIGSIGLKNIPDHSDTLN
jgi:hypothetical protein